MRWLPILFLAASCHAQQALLLSGRATVPLPAAGGTAITNTTAGLVNWWKFDENTGTTAADSAGAATGAITSGTWTNGVIGSAVTLNGATTFITLATNTGVGAGPLTFTAWIWSGQGDGDFIYDSDDDNQSGFFFSMVSSKPTLRMPFSGSDVDSTADIVVQSGRWEHIAASWDGTTGTTTSIKIWTNAVLITSYLSQGTGAGAHTANTTGSRYIGKGGNGSANVLFFGSMDDARVYNRVLSAGEITNIFQWRGQP